MENKDVAFLGICKKRRYKKIVVGLVVALLVFISALGGVQAVETKKSVRIGLLIDGREKKTNTFVRMLRSELGALLGSTYDIKIEDDHILDGQWAFERIGENYHQLVLDPRVDIIVGAGPISGSVIAKNKTYPKPVIALGIIDPVIQGLAPVHDNRSGIFNLTYVLGQRSILKDMEIFHSLYPYQRLGFVYFKELIKTVEPGGMDLVNKIMDKNRSGLISIPISKGTEEVIDSLDRVDALYITYLGKFEGKDKLNLIQALNKRKIPSFGGSIADTKAGMLAAMAPEDVVWKVVRRVSLNIEAILEGKNLGDLPVYTDFEKSFTINIETAARIGFSPKFSILSQAKLINENYVETNRQINLVDVMKEALETSLDLDLSKTDVTAAGHDLSMAKTGYYPSLAAELNGVVIDEKRARQSNGTMAQTTTTGGISANQLIYSDQVLADIKAQKGLVQASEFGFQNTRLDVVLESIDAYFKILLNQTTRNIFRENLDLIKQNLKIAEQREIIGYSGRSDVLRWKSQEASASTDLLAAKQQVILAKNELNRILNRSQGDAFLVQDTSLDNRIFSTYAANAIEKYIDNQNSLDLFTRFFVNQSIENSVEIKQLDENRSALQVSLNSLKRKNYLPTVNFQASQDHVFSRSGAGDIPGANSSDDPWNMGIYLNLPFYDSGVTSVEIQKTSLDLSKIKIQKRQLAQKIEISARGALSDVMVKMVTLESSRKAADYAKQSLELVQDAYAKGAVSVVELVDAQNNALTGELSAVSSVYEYLVSLFHLERVYGRYSLLLSPDSEDRMLRKFQAYFKNIT